MLQSLGDIAGHTSLTPKTSRPERLLPQDTALPPKAEPSQYLAKCGWPDKCRMATSRGITKDILVSAPLETFPNTPFGLIGPPGCGKTFGLAGVAMSYAARCPQPLPCFYLNWPTESLKMRMESAEKRFRPPQALEMMQEGYRRAVYVLDDLGNERSREQGSFDQEQLWVAINAAYENNLLLFWSSNLGMPAIQHRYGGAFASRLFGLAPAIILPDTLKDRRQRPS